MVYRALSALQARYEEATSQPGTTAQADALRQAALDVFAQVSKEGRERGRRPRMTLGQAPARLHC